MEKGFTLIELLVVIAIIGILSSIMLVSGFTARNKALDSRVISDMSQIRSMADILYKVVPSSYADANCSSFGDPCTCINSSVRSLCSDIAGQGGTNFVTNTGCQGAYCVQVTLPGSGHDFCVDSAGFAGTTNTACDAATCDCATD